MLNANSIYKFDSLRVLTLRRRCRRSFLANKFCTLEIFVIDVLFSANPTAASPCPAEEFLGAKRCG